MVKWGNRVYMKLNKSCADMQPIPDRFTFCLLNKCDANDDGIYSRNFARIFVISVFIYCWSLLNHHLGKFNNLKKDLNKIKSLCHKRICKIIFSEFILIKIYV
jgi:hypothetical protein